MTSADSRFQLFLETRGFRVPVDETPFTIGHASTCDFQIEDDPAVSPLHAEIVRSEGDAYLILDMESDTGVRVNGRLIVGHQELVHGDVFTIGGAGFRVEFERMVRDVKEPAESGPVTAPVPSGRAKVRPWMIVAGVAAIAVIVIGVASVGGNDPKSVSELVREAKPSTMLIKAFNGKEPYSSGSAWVYDADRGLIVTNSHVLIGADSFGASLEGESKLRDAEVFAVDECDDVAMLSTRVSDGLRTFPLASEDDPPEQGEDVIALGYPSNASTADELQATTGSLSALNINWDEPARQDIDFAVYPDVYQVDAAINPGNSGGPLFDDQGRLIGMNSTRGNGDNQGFAVSIDRLRKLLPGLSAGESTGWGGFTFTAHHEGFLNRFANRYGLVGGWTDPALVVESVIPGSAADQAGLETLDGIYAINGRQVTSRSEYCDAVGDASGESVELSYYTAESLWAKNRTVKLRFE